MEILPATTFAQISTQMLEVVTDNILPVLSVLGFAWGIYFVTARLNNAKKGKI